MKEYKIIEVKKDKDFETAETIMKEMSEKGWEVVSIAPDAHSSLRMQLMITFQRNI